jgi:hypothetical protein
MDERSASTPAIPELPPVGQSVPFALLHHTGYGEEHYDLLVQIPSQERVLAWRLSALPQSTPGGVAVRIADHRAIYLSYEGPVSGDRGQVRRVTEGAARILGHDSGTLELRLMTNPPCEVALPLSGDRIA